MAMTLIELRRKRAELVGQAKAVLTTVDGEKRDITDGERQAMDGYLKQADLILADIERLERLDVLERNLAGAAGTPHAEIGMGRDDVRQYSLVRAIRAAASGSWRDAELERQASEAVAQRLGKQPQGFYVPFDVQKRDLVVGTPSAGGNLVATDLLAQSFIEMLRNRMMLRAAGATVLAGLVGDMAIPKQTGGATAYWVGESAAPTESQQAVGQVALAPKTVGAFTDISRKLLKQSSVDVEAFVRADLSSVLALAIDSAGLHGPGSGNAPSGITATSGIGSVAGGNNGAAPTWANIVSLETEVAVDNADVGRMGYMTNAKVRGTLKTTPKTATYGDIMIWENGSTPLNGYPAYVTNQVSSTLTKGTATTCSGVFFGNWGDLIVGMWGGLDIVVDPYTGGTSGTVRVIALQDVDIAVRHAESFAAMLDALTA